MLATDGGFRRQRNLLSMDGGVGVEVSGSMRAGIADAAQARQTEIPALLCAFANTFDVEDGSDALADPAGLTEWLTKHGLLDQPATAGPADVPLARRLRDGVRQAMIQHHDGDVETAIPDLDEVARLLPLRTTFDGTRPRLVPSATGVRAGLARVLVAIVEAQTSGTWIRLKLCGADDCAWAYYDTSKNRSRLWCSMEVCGNRQKTRAYRARRRAAQSSTGKRSSDGQRAGDAQAARMER
jgi:predicted RNA-binding Zn ribbon-like protein